MCVCWVKLWGCGKSNLGQFSLETDQKVLDWPNLRFKIAFVHCRKQTRLINRDVCVLGQYGVAENPPGRFLSKRTKKYGTDQIYVLKLHLYTAVSRLINTQMCVCWVNMGLRKIHLIKYGTDLKLHVR